MQTVGRGVDLVEAGLSIEALEVGKDCGGLVSAGSLASHFDRVVGWVDDPLENGT